MKEKTKKYSKTRSYPVSAIDEGISRSLKASLDWLESAYILLHSDKKPQALIHYTFAVEEFGKAILLDDKKKEATKDGKKTIQNDNVIFSSHTEKIKRAEEVLQDPSTKMRLIDESKIPILDLTQDIIEQIPKFTDVKEFPYKGNFLSFDNRMSLMYVDYDEENQKWKDMEDLPFNFSMEVGFDAFKKEVLAWKEIFDTKR